MRRLLCTAALVSLFLPALVVLPVAAEPAGPVPHPVTAVLRTQNVPAGAAVFSTVGATWDRGATGRVEVRTRTSGRWSSWTALEANDAGPDTGSDDARTASQRVVSAPLWVGSSDAYETRTVGALTGVQVVTVDPGSSAADANPAGIPTGPGVAAAAAAQPAVYTRAQWGADESLRSVNGSGCATPDYSSTVKVGFVHHTDGANSYAANDVPGIVRGIYAYHVKTNGWCDVGYNFLVDQFGRVWEGRYGGIDRAVNGAHTGGHNASTFGAALLGTYSDVAPSARMLSALQRLFAWKLATHYADPSGTATLTSAGGGTSRYPAGSTNTFNVISGHRDAGFTACPGNQAYAQLGTTRSQVRTLMGAGLVAPSVTSRTAAYGGAGVTVSARVLKTQQWSLDLRSSDGTLRRTYTGATGTSLSQGVDLKDATGAWLLPGRYTLTLSSNAGTEVAVPWASTFDVTGTAPTGASFTPITPTRVLDTRTGLGQPNGAAAIPAKGIVRVKIAGVGGVPASGVTAVAVNVTGLAGATPTFLAAYPGGTAWPGTSSVNLAANQVHATLALPKLGSDGTVSVYNGAGSTHALLDVVGYFSSTSSTSSTGSTYTPVAPSRLVDTRTAHTPYADGETRTVQVSGLAGIPAGATAVVANVTVTGTPEGGYLSAYPYGAQRPATSTVNFGPGETAANRISTGLGNGKLSVYLLGSTADVLIDVVGYYGSGGTLFTPLAPTRLLDTRDGTGVPGTAKVAGDSTTDVPVAGRAGVPVGATAVAVTLTTTGITRNGYVTAWSGSGTPPDVSDVNTWAGHDVANLVVVQLSSGGMSLLNVGGPAHLVADVVGFYR